MIAEKAGPRLFESWRRPPDLAVREWAGHAHQIIASGSAGPDGLRLAIELTPAMLPGEEPMRLFEAMGAPLRVRQVEALLAG